MAEPHCSGHEQFDPDCIDCSDAKDTADERVQLPTPQVENWQRLYEPGAKARCIKDNPPMHGFGRQLKTGDVVDVSSVCWQGRFQVSVDAECAFYDLEGYFEVMV